MKFGITLKNVGPTMSFKGDGLALQVMYPSGDFATLEQRSATFEMPSLLGPRYCDQSFFALPSIPESGRNVLPKRAINRKILKNINRLF